MMRIRTVFFALVLCCVARCATHSGVVEEPHVISRPALDEATRAEAAGLQGLVILEAMIGVDGVPHDIRVIHDDPEVPAVDPKVEKLAIDTFAHYRFKPATVNGKMIERRFVTAIDWKS
jgi:hypothetical protein